VVSASPELFFRIDGERIRTRPMKGTAPRGRWLAEDEAVAAGSGLGPRTAPRTR
jgi:para-aminobenzoate synthetase/4-amino-4-deoxychorismate lyase